MIDRRTLLTGVSAVGVGGIFLAGRSTSAAAANFPVTKTPAQWRAQLGPDRYRILREAGTERAGTSPLNNEHRRGRFVCFACANPLFASSTKYDSGTGWPSFYRALPGGTATRGNRNLFFGTEILCARCGGHLGHVFNDGPRPTGLRYCMNGLALRFQPA
jgi:peptide-methionine (R)-S-oxide reductase